MAAPLYPVMLALAGRCCVVVGGGAVAERKARGLLTAGALVRLIAPDLTPGLRDLATSGALQISARPYAPGDLKGATLAFAATNDRRVNQAVADEGHAVGCPVNVADAPIEGDFTVPAIARRGGLTVAVSTAGGSPVLAGLVRDRLAAALSDNYVDLLAAVAVVRADAVVDGASHSPARWRAALGPETVALAEAGDLAGATARVQAILAQPDEDELAAPGGAAR